MRAIYWLGFRMMRAIWYVVRPGHRGALVAVWVGDRVLILRQSYRRDLNLPGGGIGKNETPIAAALRELAEEVGLVLAPAALHLAWEQLTLWDWRHDHVSIFEANLEQVPDLYPDGREVVEARLMSPLAVLAGPTAPFLENYLLNRLKSRDAA
jgi:8-oxo-dGTP pyrophosphatase MutT (NUDIX family)